MQAILKAAGKAIRNMIEYSPPKRGPPAHALAQVMVLHGAAR